MMQASNLIVFEEDYRDHKGLSTLANKAQARALTESAPQSPDDIAFVVFTSGTTGPAKGVKISYRALAFQVYFCSPCQQTCYTSMYCMSRNEWGEWARDTSESVQ